MLWTPRKKAAAESLRTIIVRILLAGAAVTATLFAAELLVTASPADGATASIPAAVEGWKGVPQFGMYGNATSNDCSIAAIASLEQVWSAELGDHGAILPQQPILDTYEQIVGGQDTGVYPAQAFSAWEKGIDGQKILKVSPISSDMQSVKQAIWQLGGIYAIVDITGNDIQHPNVATASTSSVTPWSLSEPVSPAAFGPIPHAVAVVGYNQQYVYLATWGAVQPVTWAWWNARVVQTWSILPQSFLSQSHGPVFPIPVLQRTYFTGTAAASLSGPYAT